ncbi:barstar family protein [Pseudomonas piscis]|uniref:barstar family protein n=1 Tax=Pseudomonas piscis TaxID=2614538 RepID=UPI0021D5E585|nr:barstar family protein [Pseudomonas piscis]
MTGLQRLDIDLSAVGSSAELHILLRDALGFPAWYGCNWDAFWDAITGLVEMPRQLSFHGGSTLSQRLPDDARLLAQCLERMHAEYPQWAPQVKWL